MLDWEHQIRYERRKAGEDRPQSEREDSNKRCDIAARETNIHLGWGMFACATKRQRGWGLVKLNSSRSAILIHSPSEYCPCGPEFPSLILGFAVRVRDASAVSSGSGRPWSAWSRRCRRLENTFQRAYPIKHRVRGDLIGLCAVRGTTKRDDFEKD